MYLFLVEMSIMTYICIYFSVERILKAKSVSAASPMAPACGLYLGHVKYDLPWDYINTHFGVSGSMLWTDDALICSLIDGVLEQSMLR